MKEIVVTSGKGGTGKTTITAAIAALAGKQLLLADTDVDAANLHLLLNPQVIERTLFQSGKLAEIDPYTCTNCGVCAEKCRFNAIGSSNGSYAINVADCEGCSLCYHLCPQQAIVMHQRKTGHWFVSKSRFDQWFIDARLGIGQENSGKLVAKVKEEAKKVAEKHRLPFILVDGPPGVSCPLISSLNGADRVLVVSEASESGLHDLERLLQLIAYFKIKTYCIINKYDLNKAVTARMESLCDKNNTKVITSIPFSQLVVSSLQQGKTLMEMNDRMINSKINQIWQKLKEEH